jgi:hypothetical protein
MSATARVAERIRQHLNAEDAAVAATHDGILLVCPPHDADRHLEMRLRDVADVEIAFVVSTKPGSPFEQVFVGPSGEADAVLHDVVAFIEDLVTERLVLAWDARAIRGGRRFLPPTALTPEILQHTAWVVSWRGTHDWPPRHPPAKGRGQDRESAGNKGEPL